MRRIRRTLLAAAVSLAVAVPAAAQTGNFYFLGDSLTDAGVFNGARFTVNPGLVWAQDLGAFYGFAIKPSTQGGTDYAQGGAMVSLPGSTLPGFAQRPFTTQVNELLQATPALNPNATYAVWIGNNDVLTNANAVATGQISPTSAASNLTLAATQEVAQIARLGAAGAKYIVVVNIPDIGKTPQFQAGGPLAIALGTQLSSVYNSTLNTALNSLGYPVIRVNAFSLLNEIVASPTTYGFTNVTGVACTTASSLSCTTSTLVAPNAASTYAFADGIHPTPAGYLLFAQAVQSMITGPEQIASLGEAPFNNEYANFRALDGRMWSALNGPRPTSKLEGWVSYDYGNGDLPAGALSGNQHANTIVVGGDMKVNANLLVGLMFGYSDQRGDFGGPGGGYQLRQPIGTVYAGYGDGPWYVGGTLGAGALDYSDITRNIPLGAAVRTETGQTRGNEYTARLLGGYWFKLDELLHGPYASLAYQRNTVHNYAENGSDSTALAYQGQTVDQLLWGLGWQATGKIGAVRPWGRVTWQYDSLANNRDITASSVSLGGSYAIPVAKPDNNYALFNFGASTDFGSVTGYVSGSVTAGRSDGNYYAVTVGIRAPL